MTNSSMKHIEYKKLPHFFLNQLLILFLINETNRTILILFLINETNRIIFNIILDNIIMQCFGRWDKPDQFIS